MDAFSETTDSTGPCRTIPLSLLDIVKILFPSCDRTVLSTASLVPNVFAEAGSLSRRARKRGQNLRHWNSLSQQQNPTTPNPLNLFQRWKFANRSNRLTVRIAQEPSADAAGAYVEDILPWPLWLRGRQSCSWHACHRGTLSILIRCPNRLSNR